MKIVDLDNIIIQPVYLDEFVEHEIKADVLRLDLIHDEISGNKWFKLQYYLEEAQRSGKSITTFGGYWSNHIVATAAACHMLGINCTGVIRGEEPREFSPALKSAALNGMKLVFTSRSDYKSKSRENHNTDTEIIIPEGGYGAIGAQGAAAITNFIDDSYDQIFCAAGTGTMTAGLINGIKGQTTVSVIDVLKNNTALETDIRALLVNAGEPFRIHSDYHFGGYAKTTATLLDFMNRLWMATKIPTDFVYTAKLFYAVADLAKKGRLRNSKILIIHSGGLQGNRSLGNGKLMF